MSVRTLRPYRFAAAGLLILLFSGPALAPLAAGQDAPANAGQTARQYFTDVVLLNQNGKPMRFYSDLLQGKVVIINAFFTSCTSVCPPMNRNLEHIQSWLGDRLERKVRLISLSVDPERDTPERLHEYSRRFHARPGWYFLTGEKKNIELALLKIGQRVAAPDDHTNIIIIGNEPTGLWKKAFGLASPQELIRVVESVLNDEK